MARALRRRTARRQTVDVRETGKPRDDGGNVSGTIQQKSSMKERARDAGRIESAGFGSSGMIVMVQAIGVLDLFSTIDRTCPVTAAPAERAVAVRPLNWAIRKRRTSFGSLVSNVNMRALPWSTQLSSVNVIRK
jgi:hypothetical protein